MIAMLERSPDTGLSESQFDRMWSLQRPTAWAGVSQGLGWQIEAQGARRVVRHAGEERGFASLLTLYPDEALGIVVVGNSGATPRFFQTWLSIAGPWRQCF